MRSHAHLYFFCRELEKQCFHISSWLSSERMLRGKHELKNDIDFKQASELQCQVKTEVFPFLILSST